MPFKLIGASLGIDMNTHQVFDQGCQEPMATAELYNTSSSSTKVKNEHVSQFE